MTMIASIAIRTTTAATPASAPWVYVPGAGIVGLDGSAGVCAKPTVGVASSASRRQATTTSPVDFMAATSYSSRLHRMCHTTTIRLLLGSRPNQDETRPLTPDKGPRSILDRNG